MIDWWTVPGSLWGVKNLDFKVELRPDPNTRPNGTDSYSEADLDAYDGDDWGYVEVFLIPVDRELTDLTAYRTSLSGVEWGKLADATIDRGEVTETEARDLALEAMRKMAADQYAIEVEEDSALSLSAPF